MSASDIQKWAKKTGQKAKRLIEGVRVQMSKSVIDLTPVRTGAARGNWIPSLAVPSSKVLETTDKTGAKTSKKVAKVAARSPYEIFYLMNNLEYIRVLEYGGYPDPVQKGTYIKGKGYEVLSKSGYSIQAPAGMVRVTVADFKTAIRRELKRV